MRRLRKEEHDLIEYLLRQTPNTEHLYDQLEDCVVEEMDDGGMGSLTFVRNDKKEQRTGHIVAEISLLDKDNVATSFAVILDRENDLYELDVFKADSSPLVEFPRPPYNELI
ncbi:MAG: hypothetical protein JST50_06910 [Bacteroidetes bacterium]|jgi:hypothetical protein|nr:hypothetical protein [Bacteroidota bacterium]